VSYCCKQRGLLLAPTEGAEEEGRQRKDKRPTQPNQSNRTCVHDAPAKVRRH